MRQEDFIQRYAAREIGSLVLPMSLDSFQQLLPLAFLKLDNPKALQAACFEATRNVPEAYYDEDAMGWHQWLSEIGQNFINQTLNIVSENDRRKVLCWLANGNPGGHHTFPHRRLWIRAMTAFAKYENLSLELSGQEINNIYDFATRNLIEQSLDEYKEVKSNISLSPMTLFDLLQQTKFRIYIIPEALISQVFIPFNRMREAHILNKQTELYIKNGGDISALEKAVHRYSDLYENNRWTKEYIQDEDAFTVTSLWFNGHDKV